MLSNMALLPALLLLSLLQLAAGNPINLHERSSHNCTTYVQRWYDSSFDISNYGYGWTPASTGPHQISGAESAWGLNPGDTLASTIGSHALVMTDVANPAVVNGKVNWNDPGKVSFAWGTETFDSYSAGSPCLVVPVGTAGAAVGGATTYTCYYSCDSI